MDVTLVNFPDSCNDDAAEILKLEVENFLHDTLEKVAFIVEAWRGTQTIVGLSNDKKVKVKAPKQVHFSSPLTSDMYYAISEDEQSQDTIILSLEQNDNEDSFDFDDSEDEVRRKFVEEGDSFVPEITFSPIGVGNGLEPDDLLASDASSKNLRQSSATLTDETEMGVPALGEEEEKGEIAKKCPSRIASMENATPSSCAVVPECENLKTSKQGPCAFDREKKNGPEVSAQERHNLFSDCKKPQKTCQIMANNLHPDSVIVDRPKIDIPKEDSLNEIEKSKTQICDHGSTAATEDYMMQFERRQYSKTSVTHIGRPGIQCCLEVDTRLGKQRIWCEEQMKEAGFHCSASEEVGMESMVQTKTYETEIEMSRIETVESTMKATESEDTLSIEEPWRKRKLEEISALIINDKDSVNHENWHAEIIRKKIKQGNDFNVGEVRAELKKHEQLLDGSHNTEDPCLRSISYAELEDQLVPDRVLGDVSDAAVPGSATAYVMSSLDPQPYPVRLTPTPHSLPPELDALKPVVPEFGKLEQVERMHMNDNFPEFASSSDAPNKGLEAAKDGVNNLNGKNMYTSLTNYYDINNDDFDLIDSVPNSPEAFKAQTNKYRCDVNGNADEELVEIERRRLMVHKITCNEYDSEGHTQVEKSQYPVSGTANCKERVLRDQTECVLDRCWNAKNQESEKKHDVLLSFKAYGCKELLNDGTKPPSGVIKTRSGNETDAADWEDGLSMGKVEIGKKSRIYMKALQEGEATSELQTSWIKEERLISASEEENIQAEAKNTKSEDPSEEKLELAKDKSTKVQGKNIPDTVKLLEDHEKTPGVGEELLHAKDDEEDDTASVNSDNEEGPYGGSQGFDLEDVSSDIYDFEASGATVFEHDQTVDITPSEDLHDVEFYPEPQYPNSLGKTAKDKLSITLEKGYNIDVVSVLPKLPNSLTAFSWPIGGKESTPSDSYQCSDLPSQGHRELSSSTKHGGEEADRTGIASAKHNPSQSILRLGLSKRKPLKRLHPYFVKNRGSLQERQLAREAACNRGRLQER